MTTTNRRSIFIVALVLVAVLLADSVSSDASSAASVSSSSSYSSSSCSANDGASAIMLDRILADEYEYDDVLKRSVIALKERGAHRCWHKHSTFLQHLLSVHNILRLWGESDIIGRVGLYHSAFSNSYVNLALFDPDTERVIVEKLIGDEAENYVYLFCTIDRQDVVVKTLLDRLGYIPKEGLTVPHLRYPDQKIFLSAETLRVLVVFTMADIADQYFGWQDDLFGGGGSEGSMVLPGLDYPDRHDTKALWPGVSKPGLWMSYISKLARLASTYDPIANAEDSSASSSENHALPPPVFRRGTETISLEDEAAARDLYWSVVTGELEGDDARMINALVECCKRNPWIFEPQVLLAQKYLHVGAFDDALEAAGRALELQQQWGTPWDKRMSFGAWVGWTRVLHQRASDRQKWPTNSWDVNNLGLVK